MLLEKVKLDLKDLKFGYLGNWGVFMVLGVLFFNVVGIMFVMILYKGGGLVM